MIYNFNKYLKLFLNPWYQCLFFLLLGIVLYPFEDGLKPPKRYKKKEKTEVKLKTSGYYIGEPDEANEI